MVEQAKSSTRHAPLSNFRPPALSKTAGKVAMEVKEVAPFSAWNDLAGQPGSQGGVGAPESPNRKRVGSPKSPTASFDMYLGPARGRSSGRPSSAPDSCGSTRSPHQSLSPSSCQSPKATVDSLWGSALSGPGHSASASYLRRRAPNSAGSARRPNGSLSPTSSTSPRPFNDSICGSPCEGTRNLKALADSTSGSTTGRPSSAANLRREAPDSTGPRFELTTDQLLSRSFVTGSGQTTPDMKSSKSCPELLGGSLSAKLNEGRRKKSSSRIPMPTSHLVSDQWEQEQEQHKAFKYRDRKSVV